MLEINNMSSLITQITLPLLLPSTIDETSFLGVYASTSALPSNPTPFSTAGIAGTGSMYGFVNGSWIYLGQYLYDAYRYLVYYNGSSFQSVSGSKWTSVFNDIASNQSLMTEFAASSTAMTALVASSTAMTAIGNSTTAMNAILPNSPYKEMWWSSSYAVGLGLNTYAALNNSTLAGLPTISAVAGNSTAMTAVAASSTAMNAIVASYTAINAMNTLAVKNAIASSSAAASAVSTLISNIISGSMTLGGGSSGSSSAIGYSALLTLLTANGGSAISMTTGSTSPTYQLAVKMDTAFSSYESTFTASTAGSFYQNNHDYNGTADYYGAVTLSTNQIIFAIAITCTANNNHPFVLANSLSTPNNMGYQTSPANTKVYIFQNSPGSNTLVSPLLTNGTLYAENADQGTVTGYYLTYTPS